MNITDTSGFNWALLVNTIVALIAIAGFVFSIIVSKKTLSKTDKQLELSKNALTQTNELFKRQIDFQFLEKKHNLFRYFYWFFNPRYLINKELSDEEVNTFLDNSSFLLNLSSNDDDFIFMNELQKYVSHLSGASLPDYTDKYVKEIEEEWKDRVSQDNYILLAFCLYINELKCNALSANSFAVYLSAEDMK